MEGKFEMSKISHSEIVEHSGRADPKHHENVYRVNEPASLPWEAPVAFRTVPTYSGPLKNANQSAFRAETDAEAVAVWLAERASSSPNTAMAYRKEVERLIFWLADQGLTLSDTSREDYIRYAVFLQNPEPKARWVNPKRVRRDHKGWMPFQSGLTPATAKQSLSICKAMLSYLHTNGWLTANTMPEPRILIKTKPIERSEQIALRQVPPGLMQELRKFAGEYELEDRDFMNWSPSAVELHKKFIQARMKVILDLAGILGARSSDLTNGNLKDIGPFHDNGNTYWVWTIKKGKGQKDRLVPIPSSIMEALATLRVWLGLTPYPETDEPPCPIVPRAKEFPRQGDTVNPGKLKPIGRSGLYRLMDSFFAAFASKLKEEGRNGQAGLMEKASLHWLRHTAGKAMVKKTGGDLNATRKMLGHSSIQTTADYSETSTAELAEILNRHNRNDE